MAKGSGEQKEANFGYMLAGLIVLLLAGPILSEIGDPSSSLLTMTIFSVTMIIGVWSLVESRVQFWIGMLLVAGMVLATALEFLIPPLEIEVLGLTAALAFCVMSAVYATRFMFLGGSINANRLAGALCVYLLIGLGFAVLNIMVAYLLPGSFEGVPAVARDIPGSDMVYYSFVTMSTLGYGDITPTRPLSRGLAYLAAVAGQFYIAMLVSVLVSMYISTQNRKD